MKLLITVFALTTLVFASSNVFAHGGNTNTVKVCGISNIPLDNLHNASSGLNPLDAKYDAINYDKVDMVKVCDYGKGIAVAVINNNKRYALIFR